MRIRIITCFRFKVETRTYTRGVGPKVEQILKGEASELGDEEKKIISQMYGVMVSALDGEALTTITNQPNNKLSLQYYELIE